MMIQVEPTPNPDSLKFLSQKILSKVGTEEFKKLNLNNIKIPFIKEPGAQWLLIDVLGVLEDGNSLQVIVLLLVKMPFTKYPEEHKLLIATAGGFAKSVSEICPTHKKVPLL